MAIELDPEQERVVEEAIRAELIRAHGDITATGVARIRQKPRARGLASSPPDMEEWFRELTAWSESHATDTPLLTDEAMDRDSIYGERGL